MNTIIKKLVLSLSLIGITIGASIAATSTGNFQSTATLNSKCTISVTDMAFGDVNVAAGATASNIITTLCTKGTPYTITGNRGANYQGNSYQYMKNTVTNALELVYNVYTDSGLNNLFWSTTNINKTGTGAEQTTNLYGRLNGNYATPGNYTDTVTLTITY